MDTQSQSKKRVTLWSPWTPGPLDPSPARPRHRRTREMPRTFDLHLKSPGAVEKPRDGTLMAAVETAVAARAS